MLKRHLARIAGHEDRTKREKIAGIVKGSKECHAEPAIG